MKWRKLSLFILVSLAFPGKAATQNAVQNPASALFGENFFEKNQSFKKEQPKRALSGVNPKTPKGFSDLNLAAFNKTTSDTSNSDIIDGAIEIEYGVMRGRSY